jgi:hypothetical protein
LHSQLPLNAHAANIASALSSLAVLATLALLTAILRWWGFIMILDAISLIAMIVILTEVLFNPQPRRL